MLPFDAQMQPLVVWEHLKDHRILLLGLSVPCIGDPKVW
jgi:hypothetical protein